MAEGFVYYGTKKDGTNDYSSTPQTFNGGNLQGYRNSTTGVTYGNMNNLSDMYSGTIDGNFAMGSNTSVFDPGSINSAKVEGLSYKGLQGQSTNWMGKGGVFDTGSQILGAATDGLGAYTALQNYELAKDKFSFEKAATNRNVANQGKMINNNYTTSNRVGLSLAGGTLNNAQRANSIANTKAKFVDTSAIG